MRISDIPFGTTDWSTIEPTRHAGEVGTATWRTRKFGDIRVRMVDYSPATWPTIGATRATSFSASTASCTRTSGTDARSRLSPA